MKMIWNGADRDHIKQPLRIITMLLFAWKTTNVKKGYKEINIFAQCFYFPAI